MVVFLFSGIWWEITHQWKEENFNQLPEEMKPSRAQRHGGAVFEVT